MTNVSVSLNHLSREFSFAPISHKANPVFNLMVDIKQIRRSNMLTLIKTEKTKAAFARKVGTDPAYISQILSAKTKAEVGNDLARGIEVAYLLPYGWMDSTRNDHPLRPAGAKLAYAANRVWVVGNGQGGLPDRIWTDGDIPIGASDKYAEVASDDEHAFIVCVRGDSMIPRYQPGEYALVEPATQPDIEDDVLVRLATGETMLKRLLSRRSGVRLGSYNTTEVMTYREEEIVWIYYVSHPIPARKIKHWVETQEEV